MTSDHLSPQNSRPPSGAADMLSLECHEVLTSFWDYRDGNCCPELAGRVRAHLSSCAPCFRLGQFQDQVFVSLAALRQRWRAPARVRDRVWEALETERWRAVRE